MTDTDRPGVEALIEELEQMAGRERRDAGHVQGPGFRGSIWGADIIEGHLSRAETLHRAAELLRQLTTPGQRGEP